MTASRVLLAILCCACWHAAAAKANLDGVEKPNIIVILIDDMGWSDLSSFGNTDALTPAIDQLASEGTSFGQFYVNSPICSPSRVALATGTYPQRWNITSYLASRQSNQERGIANWLNPAAPTLARFLKSAGYATGHFGKWHMGGQRDVADAPTIDQYGFDQSLTNFEGLGAKLLPLTKDEDGKVGKIWQDAENLGTPYTWMQRSEITTGFINGALEFMKQAVVAEKPFYVNIWPDDVHSPFWPPFEEYGLAKQAGKRALYLEVLKAMDRQFGQLFDYIRSDEKLTNNTLVVFCSDNGPEMGAGRADGLRGHKGELYEGGIRSPLIVWGPGFVAKEAIGKHNELALLAAIDLAPSLLSLASVEVPPSTLQDGENRIGTLLGRESGSRSGPVFYSRPPDRKDANGKKNLPDLAIREGDWKLLCDFDKGRRELYHIRNDPNETNNQSGAHPDIAESMAQKVVDWYRSLYPMGEK